MYQWFERGREGRDGLPILRHRSSETGFISSISPGIYCSCGSECCEGSLVCDDLLKTVEFAEGGALVGEEGEEGRVL